MKRAYRRVAFLLSLAAFLILGPMLALYAIGYRWTGRMQEAQAVGVLLVESTPRRAAVMVNGQPRGATPRAIANLPPGPVQLEVTAPGYQPYRKELHIQAGQITEARTIRLIPQELTVRALLADVEQFTLAPNRRMIAAVQAGRISVLDADGSVIMPPRTVPPLHSLLWSPDSTRILIRHPNGAVSAVNTADGAVQPLPALRDAISVIWDPRVPGRVLALLPDGRLTAHHIANQQSEVVAANIHVFAVSARSIYVVDRGMRLRHLTLQGDELAAYTLAPEPAVSQLLITPAGRVALHFNNGSLVLFTKEHQLQPIADSVLRAGWSPDGQLLYLQTDPSSVYVYNAADERHASIAPAQQQLVIRLSQAVRDVQWFAGGGYLVFQLGDEIKLAEIDTRGHAHTYTLDSTNLGQSQAEVGEEGRQLLYLKQEAGTTSLMSASLLISDSGPALGIDNLL